jgi:hypothetical protein
MVLLGDEAEIEASFGPLEIVLIVTQDSWSVCADRTIGLEIVLDTPDGTPRLCGLCGISFWSIWRRC